MKGRERELCMNGALLSRSVSLFLYSLKKIIKAGLYNTTLRH